MSKKHETNSPANEIDNRVDLKDDKKTKVKKEKVKKSRKSAQSIKKSMEKQSFIGFSGRLSLILFATVFVFVFALFLFIYLNNRLEIIRIEKDRNTDIFLAWEKFINATDQLLVRSGKNNKLDAFLLWEKTRIEFEPLVSSFTKEDAGAEEIEEVEETDEALYDKIEETEEVEEAEETEETEEATDEEVKKEIKVKKPNKLLNRINLFVDNSLDSLLNFIYKYRAGYIEDYNINIKNTKDTWPLVKARLDEIEKHLTSESISKFIEYNDTSLLVEYGIMISQQNINEEFSNIIENINEFYSIGQLFTSQLQNTLDLLDRDIELKRVFIEGVMKIIAYIVSIIAFIFLIIFFFYLRTAILRPLKYLIFETEKIGMGDLTGKIKIQRRDEIGSLTTAFNTTVGDLKTLVQQINVAVIVITKTLNTLFKSSIGVKESANAQAMTIENTRENFEKLDNMITTISEETTRANSYTEEALIKTKTGLESISNLDKEMAKIESSSEEITDIINLINYIAEQTELLSINASIEAARAGEYGKGFSVVANEIKQLAERSTQSANRIYELITYNSKIIQNGVNLSRNTANLLKEIAMSTDFSAGIVKTINEESKKIQTSSNEILGVINYIAEVASVNLMEIENVSQATSDLGDQSVNLQRFIGQFDARPENIKDNQGHIEDILKNKIEDVKDILRNYGDNFLPTGNDIEIRHGTKIYFAEELQIGNYILTYNNDFVDGIANKINTSVSFFQNVKNDFLRVSTTIINYDNTRALGTIMPKESEVYKSIINKESYYGRIFIVNRWYISVYEPIMDNTGKIVCIINLAIPEELTSEARDAEEKTTEETVDTVKKESILTA